jgi:hypothetical protein
MVQVRSAAATVTPAQARLLCQLVEAGGRHPSDRDRPAFWYYVNVFANDRGPHVQHMGLPGGVIAVRAEDFWAFVERNWAEIVPEPVRLRWQHQGHGAQNALEFKEDPMRAWWFDITDAGRDYYAKNLAPKLG